MNGFGFTIAASGTVPMATWNSAPVSSHTFCSGSHAASCVRFASTAPAPKETPQNACTPSSSPFQVVLRICAADFSAPPPEAHAKMRRSGSAATVAAESGSVARIRTSRTIVEQVELDCWGRTPAERRVHLCPRIGIGSALGDS